MKDSGAAGADASAAFLLTTLSPRQTACLRLAARGYAEREIAAELSLAPGTVRNHLQRARRRLGARNTTEAVALALVAGWLAEDDEPAPRGRSRR